MPPGIPVIAMGLIPTGMVVTFPVALVAAVTDADGDTIAVGAATAVPPATVVGAVPLTGVAA